MQIPLLTTLFTFLYYATTSSANPLPPSTIPAAICTKVRFEGGIPPSDFQAAYNQFYDGCEAAKVGTRIFPNMLDRGSRDPKHPTCKVIAKQGSAMLAVCMKEGAGEREVRMLNIEFFTCEEASMAFQALWGCAKDGKLMHGRVEYIGWGGIEAYTSTMFQ